MVRDEGVEPSCQVWKTHIMPIYESREMVDREEVESSEIPVQGERITNNASGPKSFVSVLLRQRTLGPYHLRGTLILSTEIRYPIHGTIISLCLPMNHISHPPGLIGWPVMHRRPALRPTHHRWLPLSPLLTKLDVHVRIELTTYCFAGSALATWVMHNKMVEA